MLNITNYQRNANQNYNEVSPHTSQNGHCQKNLQTIKCWRECGEKGTLLHYWWACKLVWPLCRTVWRFPKKLKIEYHVTQQSHYQEYTWRKPKFKIPNSVTEFGLRFPFTMKQYLTDFRGGNPQPSPTFKFYRLPTLHQKEPNNNTNPWRIHYL